MRVSQLRVAIVAVAMLLITSFYTYNFQLSADAQTIRVPGVSVGEWYKYNIEWYLNSTDEKATIPEGFEKWIASEYIIASVINVSGLNVTFNMIYLFPNGTSKTETYWVDVQTGQGQGMSFAATNLTEGETIYDSPEYANITITSQYYDTYAGRYREVLLVPYYHDEGEMYGTKWLSDMTFIVDRIKGVTVEHKVESFFQNATYLYHFKYTLKLVETNAWVKREVGVNFSDWATYTNITFSIETTFELPNTPEFLALYNETEWLINNFLTVNDTAVTFEQRIHFKNGTETTFTFCGDVTSGEGNFTVPGILSPIWIISANLSAGEKINDSPYGPEFRINRTEKAKIFGVERHVNVINVSTTLPIDTGNYSINLNTTWDKFTGILIEFYSYILFENETDYASIWSSAKISAASLWGEASHTVEVEGLPFEVKVFSNISIYDMKVNTTERALIFKIKGLSEVGFCNISIPKSLMWGAAWEIWIDNEPLENFTITSDDNYTYIYFECELSEHQIKIISESIVPEYPSMIPILIMMLASLAVIIAKKCNRN